MATRQLTKDLNAAKSSAANCVRLINSMNGRRRLLGKPDEMYAHQAAEHIRKAENAIAELAERAKARDARR